MPLRIAICGSTGRMGGALQQAIAAATDLEFAGGIAGAGNAHDAVAPDACTPLIQRADVLVDFSSPAALAAVLAAGGSALRGKALVIGTTGLTADVQAAVERAAEHSAVVTAANFSIGVNLLLDLVQRAAAVLNDPFDVEIVESHHRNKVDAPSGTALALARAVAAGRGVQLDDVRRDGRSGDTGRRPRGEIGLHALRGGSVVGEHCVSFLGDAERVELTHIATDRALFAAGALSAARWAAGRKPGSYTMRDVLGL
jgi:4-hydroxy-tetrahydrodipicolinate reductase